MDTAEKKWKVLPSLKYTQSDEWFDPATSKMGITDFAQENLSDVTYFESKVDVGDMVEFGQKIASVESVKAESGINSPLSGKVLAINTELTQSSDIKSLEVINKDPYEKGWIFMIEGEYPSDLMDADAYAEYCLGRKH